MSTFNTVITETIAAVSGWNKYSEVSEYTIIRSISGKISILLDLKASLPKTDIDALGTLLSTAIGRYFQGTVYCKQNNNNDLVKEIINRIESIRYEYVNGPVKVYVVERAISKKAWVDEQNAKNPIWPFQDAFNGIKPKVVTFYSFKGGMGRTSALIATALQLAQDGKNVLAIDTDIEAPGLASIFFDENSIDEGTVDYFLESIVSGGAIDMSRMIKQVTEPVLTEKMSGKVFVIPAGKVDTNYLTKLAKIDYHDNIPNKMYDTIKSLIVDAINEIKRIVSIDYILLDSRAGFHDMGGVVTNHIPHGIVLFGKNSSQSWNGLSLVVSSIKKQNLDEPLIAIVDSLCGSQGIISNIEVEEFKDQSYTIFCDNYYPEDESQPSKDATDEAHSPIYIPYLPILASDIVLYSDGSQKQDAEVDKYLTMLLDDCYKEIKERLYLWFDDDSPETITESNQTIPEKNRCGI